MKKIINGKMYNTETATCVAEWSTGRYGDFSYIEESLYRKMTGEFFLYCYGGPNTQYAEQIEDNAWTGGECIKPLREDVAKIWLEKRGTVEEYEAVFGEVEE